jgi:bifunctional UDP-N-acetylglucosamine pyrophosphorylase/glucosamine-1-phosphate N-acetyltransferase
MRNAIILAAGKGTRMKSEKNKVMHTLIDRPILAYIIDACKKAGAQRILIVAGYQAQSLMDAFPKQEFVLQKEQLGTGHAVMQCTPLENETGQTLIINGDVPCIQPETLEALFEQAQDSSLCLLSAVLEDGASYGRIVRDENGEFDSIKEAKDCTDQEKEIKEINAGVYCFDNKDLFDSLKDLTTDNAQNEYYLTDLAKILKNKGKSVKAVPVQDPAEVSGINTVEELAGVYAWMKERNNAYWLSQGVQIVDPARTVIGQDVSIGHDVVIHPEVHLLGNTKIGDFSELFPNTYIVNGLLKDHVETQFCRIEDTVIDAGERVEMCSIKGGEESKC